MAILTLVDGIKLVLLSVFLGLLIGIPIGMVHQRQIGFEISGEKLLNAVENWLNEE